MNGKIRKNAQKKSAERSFEKVKDTFLSINNADYLQDKSFVWKGIPVKPNKTSEMDKLV